MAPVTIHLNATQLLHQTGQSHVRDLSLGGDGGGSVSITVQYCCGWHVDVMCMRACVCDIMRVNVAQTTPIGSEELL